VFAMKLFKYLFRWYFKVFREQY